MAIKSSALGYVAAQRQSAFETYPTMTSGSTFFRFLPTPTLTPEVTTNTFREGGGGRYITLALKEGIAYNMSFPMFARPTAMGFLLQGLTGPFEVSGGAGLGGGRSIRLGRGPGRSSQRGQ